MPCVAQAVISLRPCVVIWLITWLTTVPLFHIHLPDISSSQPAHVGLAHTVFSPDLPSEFSGFSSAKSQNMFPQLSHWVFHFSEFGFVLSEESKDREKAKPLVLRVGRSLEDQPILPLADIESSGQHWQ